MAGLIREHNDRWVVKSSSRLDRLGRAVVAGVVLFGGGLVVVSIVLPSGRGVAAAFGVTLLLIGLAVALFTSGKRAWLNLSKRVIRAGGQTIPTSEVKSLRLSRWASESSGGRRDSGWRIEILRAASSRPAEVLETGDELASWNAAERLARELGVPLVDDVDADTTVRQLVELDGSLREWARRQPDLPTPGPPPASVSMSDDGGVWRVEHVGVSPGIFWLVIAGAAVLTGAPLLFGVDWGVVVVIASFVGLFVLAAIAAAVNGDFGTRAIELAGDQILFHGPFPRGTRAMPLDTVERVRRSGSALHFVSDARIERIKLPADAVDWVRHCFLYRSRGGASYRLR